MKRIGYLFDKIHDLDNIELADKKAGKNKRKRKDIEKYDERKDLNNLDLSLDIESLEYKTSEYSTFKIWEPKERLIFRLPYYPDRITHHAIINILEPIWRKILIKGTYSSIKGRGIHKCAKDLKKILKKYPEETKYCLKLDIRKFYPSIDNDILFKIIQRKIKDPYVLKLLREIIDSTDGVPIGNYLSQYFATLYLTYFDHWVKEELKCKYYFRYADDIVILGKDKNWLRQIRIEIQSYLFVLLNLEIKPNYQIFPVDSRGIDFVGYKFFHTHTLLRKSIKQNIKKLINSYKKNKIDKDEFKARMSSYFGWLKFCDSKHFLHKIEEETGLKFSNWNSDKGSIYDIQDQNIYIVEIVTYSQFFQIHYTYHNKSYFVNSRNKKLYSILSRYILPNYFKIKHYERACKNTDECQPEDNSETGQRDLLLPF